MKGNSERFIGHQGPPLSLCFLVAVLKLGDDLRLETFEVAMSRMACRIHAEAQVASQNASLQSPTQASHTVF